MRKKRLFISLTAVIVLTGVVDAVRRRGPGAQVAPITIQYATRIGSLNEEGPFPPGAKFLVTNNTPKTLIVKLSTIEARTGSVWAVNSVRTTPLFTLAPHGGVYANVEPRVWPQGPWRITGSVASELTGARRAWAAVSTLARSWAHGRSNPGKLFSKNNTYYDDGYEIPSQEVPSH